MIKMLQTYRRARLLSRKFGRETKGSVALEFVLVVPVMITLFFAILEFSDALSANRKVGYAATMLTDLVSQEQFLTRDDISGIYTAVEQVLEPYGIENPTMWVASISLDERERPIVDWSISDDLNEPFSRGSRFRAIRNRDLRFRGQGRVIEPDSSVIVAYIEYAFKSNLADVMIEDMTFTNHAVRWPRRTRHIVYCDSQGICSDD